jgi:hypothetical protein
MILNKKQRAAAVDYLNDKVDMPAIGEKLEGAIIKSGIVAIEQVLYNVIPNEVLQLLGTDEGLSKEELDSVIDYLIEYVSDEVKLPFINSGVVKGFVKQVINILLGGLQEGARLKD